MSLKTATNVAIFGVLANLAISLFHTTVLQFDLISYVDNELLFQSLSYVRILTLNLTLIAFFVVLRSKQKKS